MCRSLLISANARRRQQGERHAHPLVRVLAGGSDVDRKLLMAETLTACSGLCLSQRAHGIDLRCARSGNPRR